MNKKYKLSCFEKGQALPILVIGILVIIMMAALLIDGGVLFANRRQAQAAADAGALAGAYELCNITNANPDPYGVAKQYAIDNNATTAKAEPFNGKIKVTTTVEQSSFFARIFQQNSLFTSADAVAGCIPPSGQYLLPIAWSCRSQVAEYAEGASPFDDVYDCLIMTLDWNLIEPAVKLGKGTSLTIDGVNYQIHSDNTSIVRANASGDLVPPPHIYIIMDTEKLGESGELCKEDFEEEWGVAPDPIPPNYNSALRCDLDGDGKYDTEVGGNRGWLTLDLEETGVPGTSVIKDWIENGYSGLISPHSWLTGRPGAPSSALSYIKQYRQGKAVWVPVYNHICNDKDPCSNTACMNAAHASFPWSGPCLNNIKGSEPKYHIITFAPFYVSCVKDGPQASCPGFDLFVKNNPHLTQGDINSLSAVEGFFLTNVIKEYDATANCDVNLGNCIVSLTE